MLNRPVPGSLTDAEVSQMDPETRGRFLAFRQLRAVESGGALYAALVSRLYDDGDLEKAILVAQLDLEPTARQRTRADALWADHDAGVLSAALISRLDDEGHDGLAEQIAFALSPLPP